MRKHSFTFRGLCGLLCLTLLVGSLLLTGCAQTSEEPEATKPADTGNTETTVPAETTEPVETTEPTETTQTPEVTEAPPETEPVPPEDDMTDASLVSFRQGLVGTPQLFAVAYFGFVSEEIEDPFPVMQTAAPQLCENLPFLLNIPRENVIGNCGELYCIVPTEETATVSVNRGLWNPETEEYGYSDVLYRSESGQPIVLLCNSGDLDAQVTIVDSQGAVGVWYPHLDSSDRIAPVYDQNDNHLFLDFSHYDSQSTADPDSMDFLSMAGTWELRWTEVEGDTVDAKPGTCTLVIETDGTGFFWCSYTDKDFPDENFTDREMMIYSEEMYPDCGNSLWLATIAQAEDERIGHAVTVLEDGTLLMQHSWEMDGMPMVSYGWFERIG